MPIKPLPSALTLRPLSNWALFLDVDGTLLHLQETPDGVTRSERVCQVLEDIMARLNGAMDDVLAERLMLNLAVHIAQRKRRSAP